jgi:hypothetical protein
MVSVVVAEERNGQFGFKFPIALAHSAGCRGFLYVFSSGLMYDNVDTPTCKRNELREAIATVHLPGTKVWSTTSRIAPPWRARLIKSSLFLETLD